MAKSFLYKVCQNPKGFTLLELMIVVVIIGILTAIAVPVYNNVTDKVQKAAVEANLKTIDGAIMMYRVSQSTATNPTLDNDAVTGLVPDYLAAVPSGPAGVKKYAIIDGTATVEFDAANPYGTSVAAGSYTLSGLLAEESW